MNIKAFHFVAEKMRDGRDIPADGEWLEHEGELELCSSGLHASLHPFDALQNAPGATLCFVECAGEIIEGDDKIVASRRKIVGRIDATELLWRCSRKYALSVINLWDAPQVVRDFLETGNEDLRAAARDAARDATLDAARDAARVATLDAAWVAARDAAWVAAWVAARDAAWVAAWVAAQRKIFADVVAAEFAKIGITIDEATK